MTQPQAPHHDTAGNFLPADADRALEVLLSLLLDLKNVQLQELEALKAQDMNAFMNLQPQKVRVARDYEIGVKEIMVRADMMKKASKPLRELVMKQQEEMTIIANKAERALLNASQAVRRVNERLMKAARAAVKIEKVNYDNKGSMGPSPRRATATAISEAV